jgi:hypothetical protein
MSVDQYRREVEAKAKKRREAEAKAGEYRTKESKKRTEAAKARQAAAKTSSDTTARSRIREADRREQEAAAAGNEANRWQLKAAGYARDEASAADKLAKAIAAEEKKRERDAQRVARDEKAKLARLESRVADVSATVDRVVRDSARSVEVRVPIEPEDDVMGGQTWDVFLSHASEDKADVAAPLRDALAALGVTVWLDKSEMRIGSSLRRRIDDGIRSSRYGIVVLSKSFFKKGWTNQELDGLVTKSVAGDQQSILPIWHGVTHADVRQFSPTLADKVALATTEYEIEEIAEQIADVVLSAKTSEQRAS